MMSDMTYDRWKYFAMVVLPALGTLYAALGEIWGLPHPTEVVGTMVALDAFLGVVLHRSSRAWAEAVDNAAVLEGD